MRYSCRPIALGVMLALCAGLVAAAPPKPKPPVNSGKPATGAPAAKPAPLPAVPPPAAYHDMTPPETPGYGVHGEYYADPELKTLAFTRLDPKIEFNWGGGSPGAGVPGDNFTVRWRARLRAKHAETYTLWASADDQARIWVNGTLLMDTFATENRKERGTIALTPDTLADLVVEYRELGGHAAITLHWSSPSQPQEVIPTEQLYPPTLRLGKLLFATAPQGPLGTVYQMTPTEAPKALTTTPGATEPAISWDGTRVVYTACWHTSWSDPKTVKNTELYTLMPTGEQRRITTNFYSDTMPALSRDGRWLAFAANPTMRNWDIYHSTLGGRPRQLTSSPGMDLAPVFTPDGGKIAFQTDRNGRWEIYIVNADGTEEQQLVEDSAWSPAFSSDGKKLLFLSARDGQTDIYLMELETKAITRVTNTPDAERSPIFSPDNQEIAFIAPHSKTKQDIFIMSVNGKGLRRVTNAGTVASFAWGW